MSRLRVEWSTLILKWRTCRAVLRRCWGTRLRLMEVREFVGDVCRTLWSVQPAQRNARLALRSTKTCGVRVFSAAVSHDRHHLRNETRRTTARRATRRRIQHLTRNRAKSPARCPARFRPDVQTADADELKRQSQRLKHRRDLRLQRKHRLQELSSVRNQHRVPRLVESSAPRCLKE